MPIVRAVRVAMLAPMQIELDPIVRGLALQADDDVHRGAAGSVEVVALLTHIGMTAAARAAERALALDVDMVFVVGIAGGVDMSAVAIGDVIRPARVLNRARNLQFRPATIGEEPRRGVLSCGDDLITDREVLATMARAGVIAVDMETAAVAEVCEEHGCPWIVFRSISDSAGEGLVDDAIFAMTRPDGSADRTAITRYLDDHPDRKEALARLARDTNRATTAAAAAAIAACRQL